MFFKRKDRIPLEEELELLRAKITHLEEDNKRYKFIMDNTRDNISLVTFDLKATYLYVSPSVKQVLGFEPSDMIGKSFFDFVHPDDKKVLLPLLKKYLSLKVKGLLRGKKVNLTETIEFRFSDVNGNYLPMHSTINLAGKNLLAVTRDISELKQIQVELKKYKDNLEELVKTRTRELEEKNEALKNYNKLFVGREFRIAELKEKMAELERKLKEEGSQVKI